MDREGPNLAMRVHDSYWVPRRLYEIRKRETGRKLWKNSMSSASRRGHLGRAACVYSCGAVASE